MIEAFGLNSLRELIAAIFMLGGLVFFVGSAIGMLRLPDFYSNGFYPLCYWRYAAATVLWTNDL